MIEGKNYDGHRMLLVHEETGEIVNRGWSVMEEDGEYILEGGLPPQHFNSSGRIYVLDPVRYERSFFPHVLGLKWMEVPECPRCRRNEDNPGEFKMSETRHPIASQIFQMTATELGRAVFDYREVLKALEREQATRAHKKDCPMCGDAPGSNAHCLEHGELA